VRTGRDRRAVSGINASRLHSTTLYGIATVADVHNIVRTWIAEVLHEHPGPMAIALRQRAKFEGWLKFSLAAHAELRGATNVVVEAPTSEIGVSRGRSDISFRWDDVRYDVELKTPNTNWRMPGVGEMTRPITKNFSSIVEDARKANSQACQPLVAFVIFPIPPGDHRWLQYLERIGRELELALSREAHATQITLPISPEHSADVVICCFPISAQAAEKVVHIAV
jgi:hypothetical protein